MRYLCDKQRHLVCIPYSKANLHAMAQTLGIKRCWFHRDHYDIPKGRYAALVASGLVEVVRPRAILAVIRGSIP